MAEKKVIETEVPVSLVEEVPTIAEQEKAVEPLAPTMEDFKKLMEEMEALKSKLAETVTPVEEAKSVEAWLQERVPFQAFKDSDKYKDDIHVSINGYTTVIQRGVRVEIPRYVYLAIQDSDRQTLSADMLADEKSRQFDNESKTRGFDN